MIPGSLLPSKPGCTNSFLELYVDVIDKLKENNRFSRIKSHLQHEDYNEAKCLLDSIEQRTVEHNKNVSEFMGNINGKIVKVFERDPSSGIVSSFTSYTNPKQEHGYSLPNILKHYAEEAMGNHARLTKDIEYGAKFRIHREDDNSTFMVYSTSQDQLAVIIQKLEGLTDVVDKLKGFLKEGNAILQLYNDKFIPEIQNLIVEIEDERGLKGGCGLTYCPKV